jgi:molybdate transport system substrate-binding protein
MQKSWTSAGLMAVVLMASLTGCSAGSSSPSIVVLAAASLKPSFSQLAERFQTDHPGTTVYFDFASSSDLATQLIHGATGDVFAAADTVQMDRVAGVGSIEGTPVKFATNTLVIVTAPDNPKHINSFADLTKPDLSVVISPPPVPCGVATQRVENSTGVRLHPVSEEPTENDVLAKVTTGQADAGVVNLTDAIGVGDNVAIVTFPEAADAVTTYPIALLKTAAQPSLAQQFVDLVTSEYGRSVLGNAGFAMP